jgi:hypothetical protein
MSDKGPTALHPVRRKRTRTVRHFLVLDRLDPKHHSTLRELITAKGVRVATVRRWLSGMGCDVSYAAVHGYRDHLRREKRRAERDAARADTEAARMLGYACVAAGRNPPDFLPGSLFLIEYLLFRAVMDLRPSAFTPGGRQDPRQVTKQLQELMDAVSAINSLRADFERHQWQNPTPRQEPTRRTCPTRPPAPPAESA